MKKKILGVFEPAFVPRGGAENHTLELFNLLSSEYQCEIISLDNNIKEVLSYLDTLGMDYFYDRQKIIYYHKDIKITVLIYQDLSSALELVKNFIQDAKPNFFYSFFLRFVCIEVFKNFSLPVIYFAHTAEKSSESWVFNYVSQQKYIYVVSEFMQEFFYKTWGIKPLLFTEFIKPDYYKLANYSEKKYLTMINPLPSKGLHIFLGLAESLPKQDFLIVGGWQLPDPKLLDFIKKIPNITYVHPVLEVKNIYGKTKLLLFPSAFPEGFGRCMLEVAINKIPLLASQVGAIPEVLGKYDGSLKYPPEVETGVFDISEWKNKVEEILNNYDEYSEKVYEVWLQHESLIKIRLSEFKDLLKAL